MDEMIFRKMSIAGLVNTSGNILHTPVVDHSGIDGFFDFTLDPNRFAAGGDMRLPSAAGIRGASSLAVREQLGLKLERQKLPQDHHHRPRGEAYRQLATVSR
jgi:uncharacterized protein (TIGR03435 family)